MAGVVRRTATSASCRPLRSRCGSRGTAGGPVRLCYEIANRTLRGARVVDERGSLALDRRSRIEEAAVSDSSSSQWTAPHRTAGTCARVPTMATCGRGVGRVGPFAALAATTGVLLVLAGCSSGSGSGPGGGSALQGPPSSGAGAPATAVTATTAPPATDAAPTTTTASTTTTADPEAPVRVAYEAYWTTIAEVAETMDAQDESIPLVATGPALDQARKWLSESRARGEVSRGPLRLGRAQVAELAGETATVRGCVHDQGILYGPGGEVVKGFVAEEAPGLRVVTLVREGDAWKVSQATYDGSPCEL